MEHNNNDGGVYPIISRVTDRYAQNFQMKDYRGSGIPPQPLKRIFWRPNNYRRKAELSKGHLFINNFSTGKNRPIPIISNGHIEVNPKSKLIFIKNYYDVTIIIGKNIIQSVLPQSMIFTKKETYQVDYRERKDLDFWLSEKKKEIKSKLDTALKKACNELKLTLKSPIIWSRYEDWIKDDLIDNIPREAIIHDTAFKKVYDSGVEFTQDQNHNDPIESIRKYIGGRESELKTIDSDILIELKKINKAVSCLNPLIMLKVKCKSIDDIIKNRDLVELLTDSEKKDFEDWIFFKFSIHA